MDEILPEGIYNRGEAVDRIIDRLDAQDADLSRDIVVPMTVDQFEELLIDPQDDIQEVKEAYRELNPTHWMT